MINLIARSLGRRAVHNTIAKHAGGGVLDVKFGLTLMRDKRVPITAKLMALGLGAAAMTALIALELPLEALWAFILPGLGIAMDSMADGMEMVVGSLIVAGIAMQFLAPKRLVAQIRDERDGIIFEAA